jgi:hypothetical protein
MVAEAFAWGVKRHGYEAERLPLVSNLKKMCGVTPSLCGVGMTRQGQCHWQLDATSIVDVSNGGTLMKWHIFHASIVC